MAAKHMNSAPVTCMRRFQIVQVKLNEKKTLPGYGSMLAKVLLTKQAGSERRGKIF